MITGILISGNLSITGRYEGVCGIHELRAHTTDDGQISRCLDRCGDYVDAARAIADNIYIGNE